MCFVIFTDMLGTRLDQIGSVIIFDIALVASKRWASDEKVGIGLFDDFNYFLGGFFIEK